MEEPSAQKPWLSFSSLLSHSQKSQSESDSKKCDFFFFIPKQAVIEERSVLLGSQVCCHYVCLYKLFSAPERHNSDVFTKFWWKQRFQLCNTAWEESQKLKWLGKGCVGCVPPEVLLTAMQHHTSLLICDSSEFCGLSMRCAWISEQEGGRMGHGEKLSPLEELWDSRTWRLKWGRPPRRDCCRS